MLFDVGSFKRGRLKLNGFSDEFINEDLVEWIKTESEGFKCL